jgi:DNA-binding response OmpR family regulator
VSTVPLRRALVVDDSPAARRRVTTVLTLAGWQVLEAAGADAALRAAAGFSPDLVVTAVELRSGDGVALLGQLRDRGCRAAFLALTARPDRRVHAAVAALGGTCLGKPVDPRQLVELLRGRTTGPAAQGTPTAVRVTAERVAPAPSSSGPRPAGGYPRAGRVVTRDTWAARLPLHLAQMADSARARRATIS